MAGSAVMLCRERVSDVIVRVLRKANMECACRVRRR